MKLSKTKLYNLQKFDKNIKLTTTELLEKSGYIKQVQSGLFVQMHLMRLVLNNVEQVVKQHLNAIDCMEIGLNQLQSADIWKETGRYETYGAEMFKLQDRSDKEMVFTGTNEELVTTIAKTYVESHKDLPFTFYQINNKFRDEIRCNTGLIRCKEFSMMDAYSFHTTKEDLQARYNEVRNCYIAIFDTLQLKYKIVSADSGEIGGSLSEEFVVETSDGEIEIGHIFQLDTKYSSQLKAKYVDTNNQKQDIVMGCYGIGISRLAQVLADAGRIENCLNWSPDITPYDSVIIVADIKSEVQLNFALNLYLEQKQRGVRVYLDDRNNRIGEKLNEADIIGVCNKYLIGKNILHGYYEMKDKSNESWAQIKINESIVS